jgi:hypothetical protein
MAAVLTGVLLCASGPAGAIIARAYPLAGVIKDSDSILVASVARKEDRGGRIMVRSGAILKGRPAWKSAVFRLTGGDDQTQLAEIRRRLKPGAKLVLFEKGPRSLLVYTDAGWFRLAPAPGGGAAWQFVHLEPFLRRTFSGPASALEKTVREVLSGKAPAPNPNPSARPG